MATPTAVALRLNTVTATSIATGGFRITHGGPVPPGSRLYLAVEERDNRLDITAGYAASQLGSLLDLIDAVDGWGGSVRCWLVAEKNNQVVSESLAQDLTAPVKPFDGPLTFDAIQAADPKLTYPGNGHGRTLSKIGDRWYFRHGRVFETDDTKRGFDCTTFPMALFETYPNMTDKYGTALADALGATQCAMESKKSDDVKAFFADATKKSAGLYFMWSAGHVVLVKNAVVHEFSGRGYNRTPAGSWGGYRYAPQGLWWVRKLPVTLNP